MDENFIGIYPNVLSQEECEYLIDSIEEASRRPNLSFLHGKPAEAADLLRPLGHGPAPRVGGDTRANGEPSLEGSSKGKGPG